MSDLKPFDKNELGALHTAMEYMLVRLGNRFPPEAFLKSTLILDRVKQHFIAAGGDPKELGDTP